ncbi:hypothetical protein DN403_00645 [Bacillus sp. AY2-1]|nr:hypothetical protein DN403_00645 [Bacillus sp. AY2-1]
MLKPNGRFRITTYNYGISFPKRTRANNIKTMYKHGDYQLFTSERIEKIIRNEQKDIYDVTLRVIGYEGPINPPYKLIRITFQFPVENFTNYSVIKYVHKNITPDELGKLSKFVDR